MFYPSTHTRRETFASRRGTRNKRKKAVRLDKQHFQKSHPFFLNHMTCGWIIQGGAGGPSVSRLLHLHSFGRAAALGGGLGRAKLEKHESYLGVWVARKFRLGKIFV